MINLIITPVYKNYDIVKEMCEAIDKFTVNSYLHILVDDDSDCGEFPIKPSEKRRIIIIKRDYTGIIHKNGLGQAIQLGLCYAQQKFFNEKPNPEFENVFLIEADVIVKEDWDKKMIEIKETLPEDWLTLDQQSIDKDGQLTYPTTVSPRLGWAREDLEIMKYPDFQCCLFNMKIFEQYDLKFSDFVSHFDVMFGRITEGVGSHYRTIKVASYHYGYSSRQFLNEMPKE